MVVMRLVNGKPVLARFRDRHRKLTTLDFLCGASVTHTDLVGMRVQEHAVFALQYEFDGGSLSKLQTCTGEAYRWNPRTRIFEFDLSLSRKLTQERCRRIT
jgi:hypothetical protein